MSHAKFIQIHFLSNYSSVLLNRDDAGLAKRLLFGGAIRTRISSQCQKRHWRQNLSQPDTTVRSQYIFDTKIAEPLVKEGYDAQRVKTVVSIIAGEIAKLDEAKQKIKTKQITVLGKVEIDYLYSLAERFLEQKTTDTDIKTAIKSELPNLKSLVTQAGTSGAMFGRMVTSDMLARVDAAVHVAHAFTVHAQETETDYFTALDDLLTEGEMGSAHINHTDLNSGLFYGYVVIDVDLLIQNLGNTEESKTTAAQLSAELLQLITTISPGAKKGSTAPYTKANFVLIEAGNTQPCSLSNAFMKPVSTKNDVLQNTYTSIANYLKQTDGFYGNTNTRIVWGKDLDATTKSNFSAQDGGSIVNMQQWIQSQIKA